MGYNGTEIKTVVECPYCRSTDTELFSLFGQQLLTVQYYCNACHTPFERIKDDALFSPADCASSSRASGVAGLDKRHDVLDDFATRKEGQK